MAEREGQSAERGLTIVAIVAIVAGALVVCLILTVFVVLGVGLFGFQVFGTGGGAPVPNTPVFATPTAIR